MLKKIIAGVLPMRQLWGSCRRRLTREKMWTLRSRSFLSSTSRPTITVTPRSGCSHCRGAFENLPQGALPPSSHLPGFASASCISYHHNKNLFLHWINTNLVQLFDSILHFTDLPKESRLSYCQVRYQNILYRLRFFFFNMQYDLGVHPSSTSPQSVSWRQNIFLPLWDSPIENWILPVRELKLDVLLLLTNFDTSSTPPKQYNNQNSA